MYTLLYINKGLPGGSPSLKTPRNWKPGPWWGFLSVWFRIWHCDPRPLSAASSQRRGALILAPFPLTPPHPGDLGAHLRQVQGCWRLESPSTLPSWLQAELWPSLTQCHCCSRTRFPGVPGRVGRPTCPTICTRAIRRIGKKRKKQEFRIC